MSVGSVHYVHGIPIDFSKDLWVSAKTASKGGLTRSLYKDYFELVSNVIDLKPQVVGHFDLIRLCQPDDDFDDSTNKLTKDVRIKDDWPEVWGVIISTIKKAGSYGAMFELNSAAIRKGWDCPYPKSDLVQAIIEYGVVDFAYLMMLIQSTKSVLIIKNSTISQRPWSLEIVPS